MNKTTNFELAEKLDKLQERENEGRGVSCVQVIIQFLRFDARDTATTVARVDQDKIRQYPEIEQLLIDEGLCD